MVTYTERREVARMLREVQSDVIPGTKTEVHPITGRIIGVACGYDLPDFQGLLGRLADLIEPVPRAEEIAARAYRAAADYIDWELGDTPRVMALRERADELERMAHERDAAMENHEPAPKCSEATPKCDRDALLALADEMQGYADGASCADSFPYVNAGSLWSYADRIREACVVTDDGR